MQIRSSSHDEAGFTLLETIIAFTILAIALAAAVATISRGVTTFRRAGDLERANLIMDQIASSALQDINSAGENEGKAIEQGGRWKLTAELVADKLPRNLFAVKIQIHPRDKGGPVFDYFTFVNGAEIE